jgi:predicted GNAT superfamily acetyltransferase
VRKSSASQRAAGRAGRQPRVTIRALDSPEDFTKLLDIQRRVWKHEEADLTPVHQFRITSCMGAILLGGYVKGRLVGFVYSFPAIYEGRLVQHSHLLAVLPEYQGHGVGKALKWAQRHRAIALGHNLITWTFDPLQARNANLNLHTLGAVTRIYWRNFYGNQAALVLGPDVKTDRFLVEWRIREKRLGARRREEFAAYDVASLVKALERTPGGCAGERAAEGDREKHRQSSSFATPAKPWLSAGGRVVLAEVPRSVNEMRERPQVIAAWQQALRRVFHHYFAAGYIIDDFIFGERCFYVLKRASG